MNEGLSGFGSRRPTTAEIIIFGLRFYGDSICEGGIADDVSVLRIRDGEAIA